MILDQFSLQGRVALVTGASRGLGQAMALGLAEAGADVAGASLSGDDRQTRGRVEALGRRFLGVRADLADPARRAGPVDRVAAHLGRADILVNNAGSGTRHPPEEYPTADWRELIEVHLTAALDPSQPAARHMTPRGRGQVINVRWMQSLG